MLLRFSDFELQPHLQELRRRGKWLEVAPKPMALLCYLALHRHRSVPAGELLEELWRGTVVTESSLTTAVRAARRAVDDDGRKQGVISSVRSIGYRFVAEVEEVVDPVMTPVPRAAPYVGHRQTQAVLDQALDDLARHRGATIVLHGEAGIGKSRAAREWTQRARDRGIEMHTAWCHGGDAAIDSAYYPWQRLLFEVVRTRSADSLDSLVGARSADLAAFSPAIARAFPRVTPHPIDPSEGTPYHLFQAISEFLSRAALERPLVLMIEDLQWADRGSVDLMEYLAPETRTLPLLLAATSRTTQPAGKGDRWVHAEAFRMIEVEPLGAEDVAVLARAQLPAPPPPEWPTRIAERSRGHPLLVLEILDELRSRAPEGRDANLDDTVDAGIAALAMRRMNALELPAPTLLEWAAVLGDEFDAEGLGEFSSVDPDIVAPCLEAALNEHLLERSNIDARRYRFGHALLREAVYDSMSPMRRAHLHQAIGERLERIGTDHSVTNDAIAHHLSRAGDGAARQRALDHHYAAGRDAVRKGAADRAALHLEPVVGALENEVFALPYEEALACRISLARSFSGLGRDEDSKARAQRARAFAQAHQDGDGVAEATLVEVGERAPLPPNDDHATRLLREALAATSPESRWRPVLLARLAAEGYGRDAHEEVQALRRESIACARRLPRIRPMADAVLTHFAGVAWALPFDERRRLGDECLERSLVEEDRVGEMAARRMRIEWFIEAGELDALDQEMEEVDSLAHRGGNPQALFAIESLRASIATLRGRFDEALGWIERATGTGRRHHVRGVEGYRLLQESEIQLQRGDWEEVERRLRPFAALLLPEAARLARVLAETGQREEARETLASVIERLPNDHGDPLTFSLGAQLSRAAALCGDEEMARQVLPFVQPFAGAIFHRVHWALYGTVAYHEGILRLAIGEISRALECFDEAQVQSDRAGARTWSSEIELARAQALHAGGEIANAREAAKRARLLSDEIGQSRITEPANALLASLPEGGDD